MNSKIKNIAEKIFKRKSSQKFEKVRITNKKSSPFKSNNYKKLETSEISSKIIKVRNPGIDLGRILSMYAIIINHLLFHGKCYNKFPQYYKELKNLNRSCLWHVNGFIFISGYVGYKTCKYSNLAYLWFCTLFYTIGIIIYFNIFKPNIFKKKITFINFFPAITYQYWYFTSYFGMYLFLPVINKGLEIITKSQLKITVLSLIVICVIIKDYINPKFDSFHLNGGQSTIWLLIIYLIGAYFGKFKNDITRIKKIIYCLLYILIYYCTTNLCIKLRNYDIDNNKKNIKEKMLIILKQVFIIKITSVTMILKSISIILFLVSLNYNKYIGKIITFIGPLTYGIYIIHDNAIISAKIISNSFNNYSKDLSLNSVKIIIYLKAIKIFVICTIIDYLRNLLFTICSIRKLCILIEEIIFKLFT